MSLTRIRARFVVTLPRVTMFLLVGAGLATSVVVYQAYQAQRSHEETVARALAEYGAFALWQFSERLPNALFGSLAPAYRRVIDAGQGTPYPRAARINLAYLDAEATPALTRSAASVSGVSALYARACHRGARERGVPD